MPAAIEGLFQPPAVFGIIRACDSGPAMAPAGDPDEEATTILECSLLKFVLDGVAQTRAAPTGDPLRYKASRKSESANQYCLFLKPWIMDPGVNIRAVLSLVMEKIDLHDLFIEELAILPAQFLKKYDVMPRHYRTLDLFARAPRANVTAPMQARFRKLFSAEPSNEVMLGGYEFLEQFADISPFALQLLWENVPQHRLADGFYCATIMVGNRRLFLVNGFVPNLMNTYVRPESVIVVFSLKGALSWSRARKVFVGGSDPATAAAGSLRNELFLGQADLGIADLRLGANGVHFSAGPVEALIELRRFMSPGEGEPRPLRDFQFGQKLQRIFSPNEIQSIAGNTPVAWQGEESSIFELTAEQDEEVALRTLLQIRDQLPGQSARRPD